MVGAKAISAGASILTGLGVTLVLFKLTEPPMETGTTPAREVVDVINTCPVIQTGAGKAMRRSDSED